MVKDIAIAVCSIAMPTYERNYNVKIPAFLLHVASRNSYVGN